MMDPHYRRINQRVSWSRSFALAVKRRMSIEEALRKGEVHSAAFQLFGTGKGVLQPRMVTQRPRLEAEVTSRITAHAPWLEGNGLAHRRSNNAATINGFYYQ